MPEDHDKSDHTDHATGASLLLTFAIFVSSVLATSLSIALFRARSVDQGVQYVLTLLAGPLSILWDASRHTPSLQHWSFLGALVLTSSLPALFTLRSRNRVGACLAAIVWSGFTWVFFEAIYI